LVGDYRALLNGLLDRPFGDRFRCVQQTAHRSNSDSPFYMGIVLRQAFVQDGFYSCREPSWVKRIDPKCVSRGVNLRPGREGQHDVGIRSQMIDRVRAPYLYDPRCKTRMESALLQPSDYFRLRKPFAVSREQLPAEIFANHQCEGLHIIPRKNRMEAVSECGRKLRCCRRSDPHELRLFG
jgi:hypothetical protein